MDAMIGRLSDAKQLLDQQTAALQPRNDARPVVGRSESEQDGEPVTGIEDEEQEHFNSFDDSFEDAMDHSGSRDGSEIARRPRALFDAMDSLERARGSAATPMASPGREIRASIDELHSLTLRRANQASNMQGQRAIGNSSFRPKLTNQGGSRMNHRNSSPDSTDSGSFQSQVSLVANCDQNENQRSHPISISQAAAYVQKQLAEVQQEIMTALNIPKHKQDGLVAKLRLVVRGSNHMHRSLQEQDERTNFGKAQLLGQLEEARRQLRASEESRYRERDILQRNLAELELKDKNLVEKIAETEERWKKVNGELIDKLSAQEEQLQGKRALWMMANPSSSARRDAMTATRDPFTSPTANPSPALRATRNVSNMSSSTMSTALTSKALQELETGVIAGPARRVPTLRRRPHLQLKPLEPRTELGDSPPRTSLVIRRTPEEEIRMFQDLFTRLYGIIEGWVKTHANIPDLENDSVIAGSQTILWSYMMNCAYPGHRQDSQTHVMTLLGDERTRIWFVMRIVVQYCIREIMSIEAFADYNSIVKEQIHEAQGSLKERGLANEARQRLVDLQCNAVLSILGSYDYSIFRSKQLAIHTKNLRDLVGALLTNTTVRTEAGRDLGVIVINAWELSVKMWTSHLSFQIYFPETNSKFSAATMAAKDRVDTDPMQLQLSQTRLKLVITPVVTLRDDRRTTIVVNNIKHAMVLTMA